MALLKSKKYTGVFYEEIKEGKDKTFYIRYKDAQGKGVTEKIGRYSEGIREPYCKEQRDERLNMIRHGELPPAVEKKLKKTAVTFKDLAEHYFKWAEANNRRDTKNQRGRYNTHLHEVFGERPAATITRKEVETFLRSKTDAGLAPATVNHLLTLMRIIYNHAENEEDFKGGNPTKGIKKLKLNNARERYFDEEECRRLLAAMEKTEDKNLQLFTALSLTTGGRLNTILNIRVKDIDHTHGIIHLQNLKTGETYKGFIAPHLKETLKELTQELKEPNAYLIGGKLTPLDNSSFTRRVQEILNDLFNKGLAKDDRKNRAVTHTLRHTFGSLLAIKGTPVYTIQKLMDHGTIEMTLRYAKLSPEVQREAVGMMAGIFAGGEKC